MDKTHLEYIAKKMVAPKKGILAADESTGTMTKRLDSIGVASTEENRRKYRQMLFTTDGMEHYISGVILYDETIRQKTDDGVSFPKLLQDKHVLPGIKVDIGKTPLANSGTDETITEGLDGLGDRLAEYKQLGAAFAKWRGVIMIGEGMPTDYALHVNAHALARYAALCQAHDIVPIVEPEVLMDGDHDIDRCFEVTEKTLNMVFDELEQQHVYLEGIILKPNMVIAGKSAANQASIQEVAEKTVECFLQAVPAAVPGVVFLSGGQTEQQACEHLNAMNNLDMSRPWELSFSYGRALQASALKVWGETDGDVEESQAAFLKRCKLTSAARSGEYTTDMEA